MPMITVRILKGHSRAVKRKIAEGFSRTVTEAAGIPAEDIWIVFEDVAPEEWYVGGRDCSAGD